MTPKVSVIIPVVRPEKAQRCIEALKASGGIPGELCEIIAEEDVGRIGCPAMVAKLTAEASADLIMFLGDDTIPQPGIIAEALKVMEQFEDGWGLVCLNDGVWEGVQATHWLAHKRLLPYLDGEFFSMAYRHGYCDAELTDIAQELGRYAYALEAKLIHDHPQITGKKPDHHYSAIYAPSVLDADQRTYWRRKRDRKGFNIGIGLPLLGDHRDDNFWIYFINMDKPDCAKIYVPIFPVGQFPNDIAVLRENLVPQALDDGISHLVMMDTDQIHPFDTITKLAAHAQSGKAVVSGVVHRRYPPFDAILQRGQPGKWEQVPDEEKYSGDLIPIDATGAGCMMIDTSVFIDMPRPWFELPQSGELEGCGEDISFCIKARARGFDIWADTSIEIDHVGRALINRAFYEMYKRYGSDGPESKKQKEARPCLEPR